MKTVQIVIEGVSEEHIQKNIEKATKGWKLFFEEPRNSDFEFMNPFFGHTWNGTSEDLKRIISNYGVNKATGRIRPMILVFQLNGADRFAWCSWEKVLYDFHTQIKHPIEPKFSANITDRIKELCK